MKLQPTCLLSIGTIALLLQSSRANAVELSAGYETGTLDSGIPGLMATGASAADAALIKTDYKRSGAFAISHKVTLNDASYTSSGAPRSESSTSPTHLAEYRSGTHAEYQFSVLLKDWEDWNGTSTALDIIWQFKHTDGSPDASVGVRRNQLVLRYGTSGGQVTILKDIRPYDNQWIDFKFDITWSTNGTGHLTGWVRPANQTNFTQFANLQNLATFVGGDGAFGYLKWGLYRPNSSAAHGDPLTREVYHDDILVTVLP